LGSRRYTQYARSFPPRRSSDLALDKLFGGDSGAETGDEDVNPVDPETGKPTENEPDEGGTDEPAPEATEDPDSGTVTPPAGSYDEALAAAKKALDAKSSALEKGDMVAYAQADEDLTKALETLLELSE